MKEMFEYTNIISFVLRYYCLTVYMGAVFEKKFREISKKNIIIVVLFYVITYFILDKHRHICKPFFRAL